MSRLPIRVISVSCLSLALVAGHPSLAATFAVFGVALFAWSVWGRLADARAISVRMGAAIALLVLLVASQVSRQSIPEAVTAAALPLTVVGGMACIVIMFGAASRTWRTIGVAIAISGAVLATGQLAVGEWDSDLGTDVYQAHKTGGEALLDGLNPYGEEVRFFNGSPFLDDDAVFVGYPYPPVVLFTYGLVGGFTDPRLVSIVAWLAVLIWAAAAALSKRRESDTGLLMCLLLATMPAWPLIWYASWTEPLSLALLLGAAIAWRRGAILSGILLGLAVASKQYLVFLAPLLILHRDDAWKKRAVTAGATALATLAPPLMVDAGSYVSALIGNPTGIGYRPDSVSLVGFLNGLGIRYEPPHWAWLLFGFVVAGVLSFGSRSRSGLLARAGLVLGVTFVAGYAFPNYWFLILGMLAISTVLDQRDRSSPAMAT